MKLHLHMLQFSQSPIRGLINDANEPISKLLQFSLFLFFLLLFLFSEFQSVPSSFLSIFRIQATFQFQPGVQLRPSPKNHRDISKRRMKKKRTNTKGIEVGLRKCANEKIWRSTNISSTSYIVGFIQQGGLNSHPFYGQSFGCILSRSAGEEVRF